MHFLKKELNKINNKIDELIKTATVQRIYEEIKLKNTKELLWQNFISGVSRGIGIALGFSLLGALAIYFLRYIGMLNLPVIGSFISELIEIVETQKKT